MKITDLFVDFTGTQELQKVVHKNKNSTVVEHLKPYTKYAIYVTTFTSDKQYISNTSHITTMEDSKSGQRAEIRPFVSWIRYTFF